MPKPSLQATCYGLWPAHAAELRRWASHASIATARKAPALRSSRRTPRPAASRCPSARFLYRLAAFHVEQIALHIERGLQFLQLVTRLVELCNVGAHIVVLAASSWRPLDLGEVTVTAVVSLTTVM